jgi:uncharacterized damage-inducible protein DinB
MSDVLIKHFLRLNGYESWANALVLDSVETIPPQGREGPVYQRVMGLLPHNQLARQVWLWRLNDKPYENPKDWFPARSAAEMRPECARLDREWTGYLTSLTDADLAGKIRYTSSAGLRFESVIHDVLTHVFNHGTYHRGQIARMVHELGGKRAETDYIGCYRVTQ